MRLMERQLREIRIAPRIAARGALGGRSEAFSRDTILVRGSVLPEEGSLRAGEKGLASGEKLRLLVPADTPVQAGDGAWLGDEKYIIHSVRCWSAHLELNCEARA